MGFVRPSKSSLRRQSDMMLTAPSGFYDRFSNELATSAVGEGTLISGLFRLLQTLRDRATVMIIERDRYESVLTTDMNVLT